MVANPQSALSALGRALIQYGKLPEAEVSSCAVNAGNTPNAFLYAIAQRGLMNLRDIARVASHVFGYPLLDLSVVDQIVIPRDIIDEKLIKKHQVVPLKKRQNAIVLAVADPSNTHMLDEIRFQTGMQTELVVAELDKLTKLLDSIMGKTTTDASGQPEENIDDFADLLKGEDLLEDEPQGIEVDSDVDDAPIVKFIQKILTDAVNDGASDIHFEPYEKQYRVRVRTDGQLREIARPPAVLREKIASRIKVISRLDISEKRIPQDGRMKLSLSPTRTIDFRVSTLPTLHGEKIVMRILDANSAMLGIDALGYEPDQKELLLDAVNRPYGMVLVTGPTGSGKTVSLYTCLNILNNTDVNISTAEDPAEINLYGINQVNISDKTGLTFAAALRSFLRQDPDVIMVGEIRDLETAEIAIKAAQTGHMVLSTVHTNDAPSTLDRLRAMGIAPFNIASSIILITAQRLARKLCECKKPVDIPVEALLRAGFKEDDLDGSWQPYGPNGCDICKGSGYKGRVGIYQVMPISEEIAHIIMSEGNSMDIAAQAELEGIRDLRQSGLLKVKQGVTSLEEVLASTNE